MRIMLIPREAQLYVSPDRRPSMGIYETSKLHFIYYSFSSRREYILDKHHRKSMFLIRGRYVCSNMLTCDLLEFQAIHWSGKKRYLILIFH